MGEALMVTIAPDIPTALRIQKNFSIKRTFPHLFEALNLVAGMHVAQWRSFASGEPIPGAPRVISGRGDYIRSITADLSMDEIKNIFSKGPWTDQIERGHAEIDLKPGMLRGPKARMGKNGPYNIIPFRNGIPNSAKSNNPMPPNVYSKMLSATGKLNKDFAAGTSNMPGTSKIVGKGPGVWQRVSGQQDLKLNYQWGYKLPASEGGSPQTKKTSGGEYTWKTGKYTGMVRMQANTKKAVSSSYITFRVVSYKSDPNSWIVPKQDPIAIRQAVVDALKDKVKAIIKLALEEDLTT